MHWWWAEVRTLFGYIGRPKMDAVSFSVGFKLPRVRVKILAPICKTDIPGCTRSTATLIAVDVGASAGAFFLFDPCQYEYVCLDWDSERSGKPNGSRDLGISESETDLGLSHQRLAIERSNYICIFLHAAKLSRVEIGLLRAESSFLNAGAQSP